ncbi:MAG: type IX secretion system sortase PorU [Ignavibacterium album]|uniref:type IX secretion system sortase PorU n=1 Tax=Ignavibacterium album TaxID=591197 RepID=UPI0026EFA67C|nr:type IX secretion system sortase PorU [Ignavibacterium album]MBI5660891.1 type IX secretion system sortase PorU [Ignavibacterium album]
MKSRISYLLAVLIIFSVSAVAQSDIKVINSDFNSLIVKYTPDFTDTSIVKIDSEVFRNVSLLFGKLLNPDESGKPAIPKRIIPVGIPDEFGNSIEVLNYSYKEIDGQIIPIPEMIPDSVSYHLIYNKSDNYYTVEAAELVSFGESGYARDILVQNLIISPVQFDPIQNKIKLYSEITFRINFSSAQISSKPVDNFLQDAVINFDVAKYWNKSTKKTNKITVTNSVLANGKWVRFETPEEGIYKITRSQLSSFGIDPNTVDPRTIKIYNNGGKILPELQSAPRPIDLVENAIMVVGEDDGKFDANDYILFYGRGTNFFDYDSDGKTIKRFKHPYSKSNFYWITSGGNAGKRMTAKTSLSDNPDFLQNSTVAFAYKEDDKINLGKSGRQWFGDDFSQSILQRVYMNKLDARIPTEPVKYNVRFIVGSSSNLTLTVSESGSQIYSGTLAGYGSNKYQVGSAYLASFNYTGNIPNDLSSLTFRINPAASTSVGYLDYFVIEYRRELKALDDYLVIFSNEVNGIIEYQLGNFSTSNISVFDVTDFANVRVISNATISGGNCSFRMNESASQRSKYIALESGKFKTPVNPTEISNSNLRGEITGAEFIIISPKEFLDAANRLKNYRETQTIPAISTIVAEVDKIFNEFSGGLPDVTALRDYVKYAYENWQVKPKYVLLFGKGTYDYKNIEGFGDNFVPTWQSEESLILIYNADSYTTDDFFVRTFGDDNVIDLSVGRIPARSLAEMNNYIDKIIKYEKNSDKSPWRNLITLVSDDGWTSSGDDTSLHTRPNEEISKFSYMQSFDFNKIYLAAYPPVITSGGRRKPEVNEKIISSINEGTVYLNYIGHGNPEVWTHEIVFEKTVSIPRLKNDRLFVLGTFTCDFGYFDIPNYQSGAEQLVLLKDYGAIAAFTAARLVFAGENEGLNKDFINRMFNSSRDTLNLPITLGKAFYLTKLTNSSVNDQKYVLLGDPTIRLNIPVLRSVVDSVNGQLLTNDVQIKALSKVKIDGRVVNSDNTTNADFNGEGILTVFDSERDVPLPEISPNPNNLFPMTVQNSIIFRGRVSIINGLFSTEFYVPKDISYENKNGKINLYFFNQQNDGVGFSKKIVVGGTDSSVANDGKGPEINIFFDDENYQSAYLVGSSPLLIVKLNDETGLNTTGTGIGHKLEGILNEQVNNPIDFTNYFTSDLDAGGKSGKINYQFSKLDGGDYSIQIKAWDIFNNFSTEKAYFSVVGDEDLVVRDIYNYPNPFGGRTTFTFQQNLSEPIDVKIRIFTIAGRLIKEIERQYVNDRYVTIDWDGRDTDGNELANGTYLYKLIVRTSDGKFNKSYLGKLAVVR